MQGHRDGSASSSEALDTSALWGDDTSRLPLPTHTAMADVTPGDGSTPPGLAWLLPRLAV